MFTGRDGLLLEGHCSERIAPRWNCLWGSQLFVLRCLFKERNAQECELFYCLFLLSILSIYTIVTFASMDPRHCPSVEFQRQEVLKTCKSTFPHQHSEQKAEQRFLFFWPSAPWQKMSCWKICWYDWPFALITVFKSTSTAQTAFIITIVHFRGHSTIHWKRPFVHRCWIRNFKLKEYP